jgi:hypothetical protein
MQAPWMIQCARELFLFDLWLCFLGRSDREQTKGGGSMTLPSAKSITLARSIGAGDPPACAIAAVGTPHHYLRVTQASA